MFFSYGDVTWGEGLNVFLRLFLVFLFRFNTAFDDKPRHYDDRSDWHRQSDRRNEETRGYCDRMEPHRPNRREDRRNDRKIYIDRREPEISNRDHEKNETYERKSLETNNPIKEKTPEALPQTTDGPSTIKAPEEVKFCKILRFSNYI